jgi:general secretion pathway protein L
MGSFLSRAQRMAGQFLAWWLGELVACVPASLRNAFNRTQQMLVVRMTADGAEFRHGKGDTWRELGRADPSAADPDTVTAHVASLLRSIKPGAVSVTLLLPRPLILRHLVNLPLAAAENLREVLSFEMDRHTPFKAEQVYFDYRLVDTDTEAKRIGVDLAAVPRSVADPVIAMLAAWNLSPQKVGFAEDDDADGGAPFNLLPAAPAETRGTSWQWATRVLLLAVVALLAAAIYLPVAEQSRVLAAVEDSLAQARIEATEADRLKKRLASMVERNRFLIDRKSARLTVTELLHEVTRLLPDDTWIIRARLQGDKLTLSGYSATASALIASLEGSDGLAQVRFSSPVTLDRRVGVERFDLSAVVLPRGGG